MNRSKSTSSNPKATPKESNSSEAVSVEKVESVALPGSPEYVQAQMAQKGCTLSAVELMSVIGKRSVQESSVKLIVVTVFDNSGEKNHLPVAVLFSGDCYAVKDNIKCCKSSETIVNGVTIPVVLHADDAKFISNNLMRTMYAAAPQKCRMFATYLKEQCEQAWMVFAVPPEDNIEMLHMAAAVDTRVDLNEYARAWKRALMGKPLHHDSVEIVNYFIGEDDLVYLAEMYQMKDKQYGRRTRV